MTEFETQCKWGDHRIKMVGSKEAGWKPYNLDGTEHNCRSSKPKPVEQKEQASLQNGGRLYPDAEAQVRAIVKEELAKLFLNYQKANEK